MKIRSSTRQWAMAIALAGLPVWAASAADYELDPSHTFIQFRISHLGFSTLVGRFNTFSGGFRWDRQSPADASIALTVETKSIDSNWAERDKHLRGREFLDADSFPQASFRSTKYSGDASGGTLEGELTLHGVTRPITIAVRAVGEGDDPWGGYRAGFDGTTSFQRKDFGITRDLGPAAETVYFDLHIEGIRAKSK